MAARGEGDVGLLMPPFGIICPTHVRFGAGTANEVSSAVPAGVKTIAFVQGRSSDAAQPVQKALTQHGFDLVDVFSTGEPSVPFINSARMQFAGHKVGCVVACGGGSVMDAGKALAFVLSHDLELPDVFENLEGGLLSQTGTVPCITVPTTAGTGAEVTANAVLDVPSQNAKISLRGRAIYASHAFVDPIRMAGAPPRVALYSGLDAVTQVIEAYTSNAATPFTDALSRPAIELSLRAIKSVMEQGDAQAWENMAWASLSSGFALANGGLGAAHGLASILGAHYGAPHGALCGRLLLPVLKRNAMRATGEARARIDLCFDAIETIFPAARPLSGLEAFMATHELPRLRHWGVEARDIQGLATRGQKASSSQKNAVPLGISDFAEILEDAL